MAGSKKIPPIRALILAGGLGTRLYPVTLEIPKPLITVRKKPLVNYLIEFFGSQGVEEIGLLIGTRHEEDFKKWLRAHRRNLPVKKIKFFVEEKQMGTFGGVFHIVQDWLKESEHFFLTNGDEIKKFNLSEMLSFHLSHGLLATVALVKVKNPSSYGVAILKKHLIETFLEKPKNPPTPYINSGLYLFSSEVFDYLKDQHRREMRKKFLMTERDVLPKLAQAGLLAGFKAKGYWFDCGTLDRWEKTIRTIHKAFPEIQN